MTDLEYIDIDKGLIPYTFEMSLSNKTYEFTVNYNPVGDFFTMGVAVDGEKLVSGEKIVYGKPLFTTIRYKDIPGLSIVPYDLTEETERITFDNLNEQVFLFLVGDDDVD